MPTMGRSIDYKALAAKRREISKQLIAKGLMEGSLKFNEVLRRKLARHHF